MDEGDLANVLKRLPPIAMQRRKMAAHLRQIRRMNHGVGRYLLEKERAERERGVQAWQAELAAGVAVGERTASAIVECFLAALMPRPEPAPVPRDEAMDEAMDEERALAALLRTVERATG